MKKIKRNVNYAVPLYHTIYCSRFCRYTPVHQKILQKIRLTLPAHREYNIFKQWCFPLCHLHNSRCHFVGKQYLNFLTNEAKKLMITADCGGRNGYRVRLWKMELQKFANETGLEISVCHFPPGTSKWNKIEHRLFSQITLNWRGKPLTSYEVVVNLIAATTTSKGLEVINKTNFI
jgi:hypothetical protein